MENISQHNIPIVKRYLSTSPGYEDINQDSSKVSVSQISDVMTQSTVRAFSIRMTRDAFERLKHTKQMS